MPSEESRALISKGRLRATYVDHLVSCDDGLDFRVTFDVSWKSGWLRRPRATDIDNLQFSLRSFAEPLAKRFPLRRAVALQSELNSDVARRLWRWPRGLRAVDAYAHVEVDEADSRAAEQLAAAEVKFRLDQKQYDSHRAAILFMREEVLRDPANARIFALMNLSTGSTVSASELESLAAEVAKWSPGSEWVRIAQIIHDFITPLSASRRIELLGLVRFVLESYDRADLVAQLPPRSER